MPAAIGKRTPDICVIAQCIMSKLELHHMYGYKKGAPWNVPINPARTISAPCSEKVSAIKTSSELYRVLALEKTTEKRG